MYHVFEDDIYVIWYIYIICIYKLGLISIMRYNLWRNMIPINSRINIRTTGNFQGKISWSLERILLAEIDLIHCNPPSASQREDHFNIFWICPTIRSDRQEAIWVIKNIFGDWVVCSSTVYFDNLAAHLLMQDKYLLKILLVASNKAVRGKWPSLQQRPTG